MEILKDRGIKASCLLSLLAKITSRKETCQFILVKDFNSKRNNDLLLHKTIPVTLYNNLLTFRDTGKEFDLKVDLLKTITNKNYNVDLPSLSDRKQDGRLAPAYFSQEYKFFDHYLLTVKNETTV